MIALGLVLVVSAYLLLRSGFQGTDPRDEILAAFNGGTPTKKLGVEGITRSVQSSGGTATATRTGTAPPQQGEPSGTRPTPGGSPRGARIITTVAGHRARPLGNWESDNAIDVVPDPNTGTGTPVKAVAAGTIGVSYGYNRYGGYRLHLNVPGDEFYYAHFTGYAPGIVPFRRVSKGDVLGYMGATGTSTPHVHLGRRNGDPTSYANDLF